MFYWDGQAWRPAVSADGMWRFDGQRWQPTGYMPPRLGKPVREPTKWTRPLQAAVIGWQAVGFLVGLLLLGLVMPSFFNQVLSSSSGGADVQMTQFMTTFFAFAAIFGVIVGTGVVVFVAIGALKRWTWLFWALTVLYLLGALGVAQDFVYLVSPPVSSGPQLPAWYYGYGIFSGLVSTGLGVAMVVAGARIGPWACRRVA